MEIKRVRLVISQPPVRKAPSEWDCSAEELQHFGKRVAERGFHALQVANVEKPEAYCHHQQPGEVQCKYCKGKAACEKYARMVGETVFSDFEVLADPAPVTPPKAIIPTYVNSIASYYLKLGLIRDWCDAIEEKAQELAKDGTINAKEHGLKFVREVRGVRRNWDNAEEVEQLLLKALNKSEVYTQKLISPTEAEKRLADRPRTWAKFLPHVTKSEGSLKLVHVSDKRAEVSLVPTTDGFDDVSGDTPPPVNNAVQSAVIDDLF